MAGDAHDEAERIAGLLDEVRAMAGPSTGQRVEELVRSVVALYGEGLARIVAAARAGGVDPLRLCEDDLVSSLLLLHGLHPVSARERIARAVDRLRERLAPDVALELEPAGDDGVVRVHASGPDAGAGGCGSSGPALARGIENAILEAAPEVARVEVRGLEASAPRERLVTLGRPRADAAVGGE